MPHLARCKYISGINKRPAEIEIFLCLEVLYQVRLPLVLLSEKPIFFCENRIEFEYF